MRRGGHRGARGSHRHIDPGRWSKPKHYLEVSSRVRIKRAKVSASKSRLTSIRRPFASTTSRAQVSGPLRPTLVRATLTSTNGLLSLCPPTSLRRLLSPRSKVLSAKPCLWQNSLCRSPLISNSTTSRLISRRLRRFPTLTTSLSVMPTVHQKRGRSTRWVRLTETVHGTPGSIVGPMWSARKSSLSTAALKRRRDLPVFSFSVSMRGTIPHPASLA